METRNVSHAASNPFFKNDEAKNPFAPPAAPATSLGLGRARAYYDVSDDAAGSTFAMVKAGPELVAEEVEDAAVASVEVTILWGTNVLHVEHLTPPRSFYLGEEEKKNVRCDFLVPAEKLGSVRSPLLLVQGGVVSAVVPANAKGTLELPGRDVMTLAEAIAAGLGEACMEAPGAHQLRLPASARARIDIGDMTFLVGSVAAGRKIATPLIGAAAGAGLMFVGLSGAAHSAILAGMAFFKPSLSAEDDDAARKEREYLMQQLLHASADAEPAVQPEENKPATDTSGGTGAPAKGASGTMGNPNHAQADAHYAIKGPKDNPDPRMAREQAKAEAATFGLIGLLNAGAAGDPNAPTAPWGTDSLGKDEQSFRGKMWGAQAGDAFGMNGLGLTGIGEGGDGKNEGVGLGNVSTIGRGRGIGDGNGDGWGSSHGKPGGEHKVQTISVRTPSTTVSGRLAPEVVQRIVRQNFGRFRLCYEQGLRQNPNLQGRVIVRFAIDSRGVVASTQNGGSDLPDSAVVSCVVRSFAGLSFPEPEGGIVTVTYPIIFSASN